MSDLETKLERIIIDFKDEVNGCYTLLTSIYTIICLPNNTYIVPRPALDLLNNKSINYKIKE